MKLAASPTSTGNPGQPRDLQFRGPFLEMLFSGQREAVADLVMSAGWLGHALVKNEPRRHKTGESWLATDSGFQAVERTSLALGAGQRDVRMIGTSLRDKAAKAGRDSNTLLQQS